jgi:hypothetical protein
MALSTATYPAKVTFNQDPDKRGVIRVACVGLMGDEDTEVPVDVEPVHDWGWFYVPDIGEVVEIECTEGSDEDEQHGQMSIDNCDLKWRSARHYGNDEGETPTPINPAFTSKNYGKRRGFATPAGHVFVFDDTEGGEEVTLSWKDGSALLTFDARGTVTLKNKVGATLVMDSDTGKIVLTSNTIEVNGGSQAMILGDLFKQYFDTHTHPTGVGPSGVPIVPMPASTLSTITKVG